MDGSLSHEEIQELLGAYALDAVDGDEAELVELHLRDCPRCRAEVEDHRETAAMLAHVGAPAPAGVWNRIAEQLEGEAPDFDTGVGAQARRPGEPPVGDAAGAGAPTGEAGSGAPTDAAGARGAGLAGAADRVGGQGQAGGGVTPIGRRRGRSGRPLRAGSAGAGAGSGAAGDPDRQSRPFRIASAALAAAAVLAVVLGVQVVRLNNRLDRMNTTVAHRGVAQAALAAIADPSARRVHLRADNGGAEADAVLLPDGQAFLVSSRLPALSADQTYQLWAVVGDQKISVGVLGAEPAVTAFRYSAEPAALAITAEKAGGVVASQHAPVVLGEVPPQRA